MRNLIVDVLKCGKPVAAALLTALSLVTITAQSYAESILFSSPGDNVEVNTNRPPIVFDLTGKEPPAQLLVMLDDTDVTGALTMTSTGFRYVPVRPLANGSHQLRISIVFEEGAVIERQFSFVTFARLTGETQVSANYQQVLAKSDDMAHVPHRDFAANLGNTTRYSQGNWQLSLITNVRWLDRSLSIQAPEQKGVDLVNYQVTGQYQIEDTVLQIGAGDLQIQETNNTVMGLARRGVQTSLRSNRLTMQGFLVQSQQFYGIGDGSGLEFDDKNHIYGGSVNYSLLSDQLRLRTIYVAGVETDSSSYGYYNIYQTERKSRVLGFLAQTTVLDGKLDLEAEYDLADYDADSNDGQSAESDRAWALIAGGSSGAYTYQAAYEYFGPHYEVIGNPSLQNDLEGAAVMGTVQKPFYTLNLSTSRYEDNVEEDELSPQVVTTTGNVAYSYTRFPNLPLRVSYQKTIHDSSMVPVGGLPYRMDTDFYSAGLSYIRGPWTFDFNTGYSEQNDKTAADFDTSAQDYALNTTYYGKRISFAQNLAFNRWADEQSDLHTDTLTATVDLLGTLYDGAVAYEIAGTYSRQTTSDDTFDTRSINTNAMLTYHFLQKWANFLNPSFGIRGLYDWVDDRVQNETTNNFTIMLVLSSSLDHAF